jgi:Fe-S cluster biogenesis protein NfuA
VVDEKEFRERIQTIGRLVAGLDDIQDNQARTSARELVQLVMELHGAAVERMMEIIFDQGGSGAEIIEKLGHDRVAGSLLTLHGLHPDDLETRVARAVQETAARLRKQDVEVQLLDVDQGNVRVSARTSAHACGSTAATVRSAIEEAVYEAAPEVTSLVIEGLEGKAASGFVALDQLLGVSAAAPLAQTKAGD